MRRMRSGLLFAAAFILVGVGASPLAAQVGPTLSGSTGLFELSTADMTAVGKFGFGLYFSQSDRTAATSLVYAPGVDNPMRYGYGKLGFTAAFGATPWLELSVGTGETFYYAEGRAWSGSINGHERQGYIRHNEWDKVRFGAKVLLSPKTDPLQVLLLGGWSLPTQSRNDLEALSTYRADWDLGFSFNYQWMTFQTTYVLVGDLGEFDLPNEIHFGLGAGIPLIKDRLKLIAEVNRTHYDGGMVKPDDFSEALAGVRFGLGPGFTVGGAVRANIDRWVKYGQSPSNIGGLVQISYSPAGPATVVASVPTAATPEQPTSPSPDTPSPKNEVPAATAQPAPAPVPVAVEPPPAPRAETSTTDEILYDGGKSRLTNIAKAILDGVALRLKNNLAATCTVTGYADKGEKGDKTALSKARADAAKDYLVKRHGIDEARVKVVAKGDADAGSDATRNRRALVTITFP